MCQPTAHVDGVAPYVTAAPCSGSRAARARCQHRRCAARQESPRETRGWFPITVAAAVAFTTRPHRKSCVCIGQGAQRAVVGGQGTLLAPLTCDFTLWEIAWAEEPGLETVCSVVHWQIAAAFSSYGYVTCNQQ